jgi:hypothetical protein
VSQGRQHGTRALEEEHHRKRPKTDHRTLSRSQRRKFNHDDALYSIKRYYLGKREEPTTPLFGAEFTWMFRASRSRFQVLMEDIMNSQHEFFKPSPQDGHERCSLEAKLLLPLKTFAFGVAAPPSLITSRCRDNLLVTAARILPELSRCCTRRNF